jgi:hypothetical protein
MNPAPLVLCALVVASFAVASHAKSCVVDLKVGKGTFGVKGNLTGTQPKPVVFKTKGLGSITGTIQVKFPAGERPPHVGPTCLGPMRVNALRSA